MFIDVIRTVWVLGALVLGAMSQVETRYVNCDFPPCPMSLFVEQLGEQNATLDVIVSGGPWVDCVEIAWEVAVTITGTNNALFDCSNGSSREIMFVFYLEATVENITITNSAMSLQADDTLYFKSCAFTNLTAAAGSSLGTVVTAVKLVVYQSTFIFCSNRELSDGGVLMQGSASLLVQESSFYNCSTYSTSLFSFYSLVVLDSYFTSCSSTTSYVVSSPRALLITSSIFTDCKTNGGVGFAVTVIMLHSSVIACQATTGSATVGAGILVILQSSFCSNSIGDGSVVSGAATVVIDCAFIENSSSNGNVVQSSKIFLLINSSFYANTGIPVLYCNSNATILNCMFTGNSLGNHGTVGVIEARENIAVIRSHFYSNYSPGRGGAIYSSALLECLIVDSVFVGNAAPQGGAIFVTGGAVISNCTFVAQASQAGGAVLSLSDTVVVLNSTFLANFATSEGGAISAMFLLVSRSVFADNHAGTLGGAIYTANLALDSSLFNANEAALHGGALFISDTFSLTFSHFSDNVASGLGGAVLLDGASGVASSSDFVANIAAAEGMGGGAIVAWQGKMLIHESTFIFNTVPHSIGQTLLAVCGEIILANSTLVETNDAACNNSSSESLDTCSTCVTCAEPAVFTTLVALSPCAYALGMPSTVMCPVDISFISSMTLEGSPNLCDVDNGCNITVPLAPHVVPCDASSGSCQLTCDVGFVLHGSALFSCADQAANRTVSATCIADRLPVKEILEIAGTVTVAIIVLIFVLYAGYKRRCGPFRARAIVHRPRDRTVVVDASEAPTPTLINDGESRWLLAGDGEATRTVIAPSHTPVTARSETERQRHEDAISKQPGRRNNKLETLPSSRLPYA